MLFVQLVDKATKLPFLRAMSTIESIVPHSYFDERERERYEGTLIIFKCYDVQNEQFTPHFVHQSFHEVEQKILKGTSYIIKLETP